MKNVKKVNDIWFAGFLLRSGIPVVKVEQNHGRKATFHFDIGDRDYASLKLEYVGSPDSKIKYTHETLKDLIYN